MLTYLRAATQPAHDRLQGLLGLLDHRLERDAYQYVLERFYGFWRDWQPHVAALSQDQAFLGPRQRMHLLEADLAALGLPAHAVEALPRCPVPALCDAVEALGSLYVMEGSTLGGRIMQRNVERCLGFDARSGCAYFAGYGAGTGLMWRSFLARLNEQPMTDARRIANGASATFERLAWWLNQG